MIWKNKYGEIRSGWASSLVLLTYFMIQLVVGLVIGIIALVVIMLRGGWSADAVLLEQQVADLLSSPGVGASLQIFVVLLSIGAVLLLYRLLYKRPLSQMGFQGKGWLGQLFGGGLFGIVSIGLVEAVLLIFGWAYLEGSDVSRFMSLSFWGGFGLWLGLFVLAGFQEELLARGFMMTALKTTRLKALILLLPAVIFSLLHVFNSHVTFLGLVNIMLAGLLFGYLFLRSGNLWAPVGFHVAWNFFQGNIFGLAVSGNNTPALIHTMMAGPDWVSGGAFGAEGGVVCTGVLVLGLVYVHFCVKPSRYASWSLTSDMPLRRGMSPPKDMG